MYLIYIVISLVIVIAGFLWISSKGVPRRDDDFIIPFATLLECPTDEPFLLIRKIFRKQFLQFCKYKLDSDKYGLMMVFPLRKWSYNYKDGVISKVQELDLDYEISLDDYGGVIIIRFGEDLMLAQLLSQMILRDTFGYSDSEVHRVHLEQ